ncbi:hypothetical protein [Luteolibacter sp. LG18]|uniref:hypothetical protein n=1 Tax=Luteolibacter sp. LG18 TaxID=2819286 RepID=UPI002B2D659B|nr:hypothetical protein llg_04500 [Luteolibacter sp. LG18]
MKSESLFRATMMAALFLLASRASAQNNTVSLKIDLVAWGNDIPGLSIKAGSKNDEVTALAFQYSKDIAYSGSNVLEIYQRAGVQTVPADSKEAVIKDAIPPELLALRKEKPDLVALAQLPADSKRVTILLAPAQDHTFRAVVIDDDPSKLPPGKLRIHNYSPVPVALRCNGAPPKELKGRESMVTAPNNHQVIYELAYQDQGQWKMQENNILRVGDDEQAQMIILKSDSGYFTGTNGTRSGFLQAVVLRRQKEAPAP